MAGIQVQTGELVKDRHDVKHQVDGLLTADNKIYLKHLEQRLSSRGFSWQRVDYFEMQKIVPILNDVLNSD